MSRQQCCFCFSRVSIEEKQENNFAISLRTDWQSESCAPRQKTLIMANRQKQNPDWKLIPVDIVSWWGGGRFFRWGNSYFGKHWSDVSEIRCCRLSGVFFCRFSLFIIGFLVGQIVWWCDEGYELIGNGMTDLIITCFVFNCGKNWSILKQIIN